jgi:hypothetical protein
VKDFKPFRFPFGSDIYGLREDARAVVSLYRTRAHSRLQDCSKLWAGHKGYGITDPSRSVGDVIVTLSVL